MEIRRRLTAIYVLRIQHRNDFQGETWQATFDPRIMRANTKLVVVLIIIFLLGLLIAVSYFANNASEQRSTATSEAAHYIPDSDSGSSTRVIKVSTRTAPRVRTKTTGIMTTNATVRSRTQTRKTNPYDQPNITDKEVVCTLGANLYSFTKGPSDGVCDYLLYDSLYIPGRGSLLDVKTEALQWFFSFVQTHRNGSTQYGISFDSLLAGTAFVHLNKSKAARTTLREIWDMGISHYALLRAPSILTLRPVTINDIQYLMTWVGRYFRHWRGDRSVPIYRFVEIDLYKPFDTNSDEYDGVYYLVGWMRPDALIFRSHYTVSRSVPTCKITTTSSYNMTFNYYEASMVESLNYALNPLNRLLTRSHLVSFTMRLLQFHLNSTSTAADYDFGRTCAFGLDMSIRSLCQGFKNFTGSFDQRFMTMCGVLPLDKSVIVYDSPQSISRKMCLIRKAYPHLHLGMALFDIDFEDTNEYCSVEANLNYAAGYWRLERSSAYMKTVLTNLSIDIDNEPCP